MSSQTKPTSDCKVSVLIPMHNMKPYLRQCIGSILQQTVPVCEIIIVDNGSNDGSGQLADELAAQHPQIKVIHTPNRGVSAGRNTAIDQSSGDLLMPVDADDWLEPDCLETLLSLRERYPDHIPACNHMIDEPGRPIPAFPREQELRVLTPEQALQGILYHDVPDVSCWGKLWERRWLNDIRYPEGHIYEDTWMISPLILRTAGVVWTPKIGYHYRIRTDSISRSVWGQDKLDFPQAVEALCVSAETAFPSLHGACQRRRCHAWLSLRRYFIHCPADLKAQRDEVEQHALSYRRTVFRDSSAPRRDKIALLALTLGSWCFDLMWTIYTRRRS